ncbi:MAG: hypothetical protein AAFO07_29135, partial [Bacteroidota bacterium]
MLLHFGLTLDESYYPFPPFSHTDFLTVGPNKLIQVLEAHLACPLASNNNEYIRVEQYRQAIINFLNDKQTKPFFEHSFYADPFATAQELLSRRDELIAAGWQFETNKNTPNRLKTIAKIEKQLNKLSPGLADRITTILARLKTCHNPIAEIQLFTPWELIPFPFKRILNALKEKGTRLELHQENYKLSPKHDLRIFQERFTATSTSKEKVSPKVDGSLVLIKGERATELATFIAKLAQKNAHFKPLVLIHDKNRSLDTSFIQEGLPGMGILTTSAARPVLQVLKLVTTFLWEPLNPIKVLEFLSLPIKPMDDELALKLALQIAQSPGINSDAWFATIAQFFDLIDQRNTKEMNLSPKEIREQYNYWFNRKRYSLAATVPKEEVASLFTYLFKWAQKKFEQENPESQSLIFLVEQSKRLADLINTLPEKELTPLEVERLVRTVYEPAPIQLQAAQMGHWPVIYHPGSLTASTPSLLWWNFIQSEPNHFFSKWYKKEWEYLKDQGVLLASPQLENENLIYHRKNPVLNVNNQLILAIPEKKDGHETLAHPLMGDLMATFENLDVLTIDINKNTNAHLLELIFPSRFDNTINALEKTQPFVQIDSKNQLEPREEETFTSIDKLIYYPYQWLLRYKLGIRKSSILSITSDQALMGNLSHRLIEYLLKEAPFDWDKSKVFSWVQQTCRQLFNKEGAVL